MENLRKLNGSDIIGNERETNERRLEPFMISIFCIRETDRNYSLTSGKTVLIFCENAKLPVMQAQTFSCDQRVN